MALHPTNKPVLVYTWTDCQTHRRTLTSMDWRWLEEQPSKTASISSQQRQRWRCCFMVIIKRKCSVEGNSWPTDIIWVEQRANRFLCRRSDVECLMWSSPQREGRCNSRFMSFLIFFLPRSMKAIASTCSSRKSQIQWFGYYRPTLDLWVTLCLSTDDWIDKKLSWEANTHRLIDMAEKFHDHEKTKKTSLAVFAKKKKTQQTKTDSTTTA